MDSKRKVVKHGPSTYIVSLPSSWVKKYNIEKGDEIFVTEKNNSLIIKTEKGFESLDGTIDITNLDRTSIMYIIRSFYRLGYDSLEISFKNNKTIYQRKDEEINVISVIHTEVNRLIGYEIIKESENSCLIKDLQEINTKEFDVILRRIFLLLKGASEEFFEGIKKNDKYLLETIENKHDTITKFVSYCLRILNKKGYVIPLKTSYYYHIIALLDRITDIIKYAARDACMYNKKFCNESIDIIQVVNDDLKNYYELFYDYTNEKVIKINTHRYEAEKKLRNFSENVSNKEFLIVANLFQIMELLLDLIEARTALEY